MPSRRLCCVTNRYFNKVGANGQHVLYTRHGAATVQVTSPSFHGSTVETLPAEVDLRGDDSPIVVFSRGSKWRGRLVFTLLWSDVAAALAACLISYLVEGHLRDINVLGLKLPAAFLVAVALPTWLAGHLLNGSYRRSVADDGLKSLRAPLLVGFRITAFVVIASVALSADLSRVLVIAYFPTLILVGTVGRFVIFRVLASIRRRGAARIRLMLVGDEASVRRFATHLDRNRSLGYDVVGVCIPGSERSIALRNRLVPVTGGPDDVISSARRYGVEAVAVANPSLFTSLTVQRLSWALERSGTDLLVAPDVSDVAGPRIRVATLTGLPLLHITDPRVDDLARRLASAFSRLVSLPILLLLSPVLIGAALAIKLSEGGPIFYQQERIGYRGQAFKMIKFRTMVTDAEARLPEVLHLNEHDGALFKVKDDPRITRVGKWLRKYSIDELPQLLNVLRGDMVLVGPRPVLPREMANFGDAEQRRFSAKPGITGLWQVSGRTMIPWEEGVHLDLYYVENWSPVLDLLIMVRTLWVILAGSGM